MTDALDELERLLPELEPAIERRRLGESLGRVVDALRDDGDAPLGVESSVTSLSAFAVSFSSISSASASNRSPTASAKA